MDGLMVFFFFSCVLFLVSCVSYALLVRFVATVFSWTDRRNSCPLRRFYFRYVKSTLFCIFFSPRDQPNLTLLAREDCRGSDGGRGGVAVVYPVSERPAGAEETEGVQAQSRTE